MKNLNKLFLLAMLAISFSECKKEAIQQPANSATAEINPTSSVPDSLVLTPGGWLPKSHVFFIAEGYHLDVSTGHVLNIKNGTDRIMADFGEIHSLPGGIKSPPKNPISRSFSSFNSSGSFSSTSVPGGTNGWVGFSAFYGYQPITYFSTTWTVPGSPQSTSHGQTIFIFNALQNNDIIQPVLQWGSSNAGGGNYWSIGNWYGWNSNQYFAFTSLISVAPGTSLQGIISNTGVKPDGSYNYVSSFSGYANSLTVTEGATHAGSNNSTHATVTFPFINGEYDAFETIEAYNSVNYNGGNGVVNSADYPSQASVAMKNISITAGGAPASLYWYTYAGDWATVGEHANVISSNAAGTGEVDLYFHAQPPVISYPSPDVYSQGVAISPLTPVSTGSKATSYSVSPALPAYLTMNTTTGVITGTPVITSPATNYTVTSSNSAGSSTSIVNITINSSPTGAYTFGVLTTSPSSSYFYMIVNSSNISGPRGTGLQNQVNNVTGTCTLLPNSTVLMQITSGYVPVSATLSGPFGTIHGAIAGNNITFSNVNLSYGNSCSLTIN
jgi:hypothetical protein